MKCDHFKTVAGGNTQHDLIIKAPLPTVGHHAGKLSTIHLYAWFSYPMQWLERSIQPWEQSTLHRDPLG